MTDRTINWVFRATDRTAQAFRSVDSRLAGITKSLKTFAGFAGFATIAAGVGSLTKSLVDLGSELQDASDKLGVSAETLQSLKFAAEQTGASFESLQTALIFNAKLTTEAAQGSKQAVEAFRQLGIDAKKFADIPMDRRLAVIAEQLASIQNPGDRAALAVKALGRGAADLLPLLNQGAAGLAAWDKQARATNSILSNEQVKALDDAGDAWEAFLLRLKVKGAPILVGTINLIEKMGKAAKDSANLTGLVFGEETERMLRSAQGRDRGPQSRRATGRRTSGLSEEEAAAAIGIPGKKSTASALAEFDKAFAEVDRIGAKALKASATEMNRLEEETRAVIAGIAELGAESNRTFSDRAAEIKEQFADPLDVLQAKLLEINQLFAGGLISRDVSDRAVKAYTDDFISGLDAVEDKSKQVKTSTEEMFESLKLAANGFARDLTDVFFDSTQSIGEMFEELAKTIAKALFTQTVSEPLIQSILGSIGGSLFGGARAGGGPVSGGKSYLVGERGPEMFVPKSSGTIVPNGAGGSPINVNMTITSVDPQTAAQTIAAQERLITGMVRRSMQRAGVRPILA